MAILGRHEKELCFLCFVGGTAPPPPKAPPPPPPTPTSAGKDAPAVPPPAPDGAPAAPLPPLRSTIPGAEAFKLKLTLGGQPTAPPVRLGSDLRAPDLSLSTDRSNALARLGSQGAPKLTLTNPWDAARKRDAHGLPKLSLTGSSAQPVAGAPEAAVAPKAAKPEKPAVVPADAEPAAAGAPEPTKAPVKPTPTEEAKKRYEAARDGVKPKQDAHAAAVRERDEAKKQEVVLKGEGLKATKKFEDAKTAYGVAEKKLQEATRARDAVIAQQGKDPKITDEVVKGYEDRYKAAEDTKRRADDDRKIAEGRNTEAGRNFTAAGERVKATEGQVTSTRSAAQEAMDRHNTTRRDWAENNYQEASKTAASGAGGPTPPKGKRSPEAVKARDEYKRTQGIDSKKAGEWNKAVVGRDELRVTLDGARKLEPKLNADLEGARKDLVTAEANVKSLQGERDAVKGIGGVTLKGAEERLRAAEKARDGFADKVKTTEAAHKTAQETTRKLEVDLKKAEEGVVITRKAYDESSAGLTKATLAWAEVEPKAFAPQPAAERGQGATPTGAEQPPPGYVQVAGPGSPTGVPQGDYVQVAGPGMPSSDGGYPGYSPYTAQSYYGDPSFSGGYPGYGEYGGYGGYGGYGFNPYQPYQTQTPAWLKYTTIGLGVAGFAGALASIFSGGRGGFQFGFMA